MRYVKVDLIPPPFSMRSHRELLAWQQAREVVVGVHRYAATNWEPNHSAMLEQLRRAALSVQLNTAEGFASGRSPRCRQHLRIAYGSAVETTDLLDLLIELKPDAAATLEPLVSLSHRTQALTLRLWQHSLT